MSESVAANWRCWEKACRRDEVARAFERVYADLAEAIGRFKPTCWASGKCCKFETYGHRLYVTGLEIAHFRHQYNSEHARPFQEKKDAISLPQLSGASLADACRYQREGRCSVHAIRPLGCRVFFCQDGTEQWQQDTYESFQKQIITIHETHDIPYHYMEWRRGLIEADRWLTSGIKPASE